MNRISILPVMLIILLISCLSGCQEIQQDNEYSLYEDPTHHFTIEYPTAWNTVEHPPEVPDVYVLFISRSNDPTKTGSLVIKVFQDIGMNITEFNAAHLENLTLVLPTAFILSPIEPATLSAFPGYTMIYTYTDEGHTWRQQEFWTITDDTLYLLVHQADQELSGQFASTITHMITSFTIL